MPRVNYLLVYGVPTHYTTPTTHISPCIHHPTTPTRACIYYIHTLTPHPHTQAHKYIHTNKHTHSLLSSRALLLQHYGTAMPSSARSRHSLRPIAPAHHGLTPLESGVASPPQEVDTSMFSNTAWCGLVSSVLGITSST